MANLSAKYKSSQNPSELIQRAVELIENPLSAEYIGRHVLIINDFLNACTYGIWVHDISYVIKLLYLFSEKIAIIPEYRECFTRLLQLCSIPPVLTKSSEVLTFEEEIREYFTVFGYLLIVLQGHIFDAILDTIKHIFTKKHVGHCYISRRICNEAVAKSSLPDSICEMMCVVTQDNYYKLLETVECLMGHDDTCKKLIQNGMINIILLRTYPDSSDLKVEQSCRSIDYNIQRKIPYLDLSISILWKLLDIKQNYPHISTEKLVQPITWRSVQNILRMLTTLRMKKQKRNNLVCLILFILKLDDVRITCEVANDLALLCAASETTTAGTWASEVSFTQDTHDYNFKKLLFLVITYFPRNPDIVRFLHERQIVLSILRLITPEVEVSWNDKQRCKLMRYSLLALCEIMEETIEDFIRYNGPLRLLKMVEGFMKSRIRQCTLLACLYCIHKSLGVTGHDIVGIYRRNSGNLIIIELLQYMTNIDTLTQSIQSSMVCTFCIAEILSRQHDGNRTDVIDLCNYYIGRYLNPQEQDFLNNPRILIACLDFIWEYLTWSSLNLHYFNNAGGIYVLLDVIEFNCFPVQLTALSFLVDLCEEGSSIPYLLTWRGKNGTVIPMLLDIFRKENQRLGVKTGDDGLISDIELPLMGKKQFRLTFRDRKDPNSSPAILDVLGSCRPKIYALLHLLNCHKVDVVEAVNERYRISQPLKMQDEITKLLAENYFPLKIGEIWVELKNDMEVAGIRPLAYDLEIISTMVRRYYKWSLFIKNAQEKIVCKQKRKEINEEKLFYSHLREIHLSDSLDALDDLRYIARCTENVFRLMAKMKQKDQVRKTWVYDPEFYIKFHMTFMHTLSVTPVFNQKVSIRSNIIIEPNHQTILLEPVSPSDSFLDIKARQNQNLKISDGELSVVKGKPSQESTTDEKSM